MFQCDVILDKKWRHFIDNFEDFASHVFRSISVQIFGYAAHHNSIRHKSSTLPLHYF